MVPVIVPAQLSVVVGAVAVAVHCPVTSANVGVTGSVVSSMTTFWICVLELLLESVNVHVTTVVPWVVIGKVTFGTPVNVPPQLSVAVGAVIVVTSH